MFSIPVIFVGGLVALFLLGVRVLTEYERGVVFRLGRYNGNKEAGLKWIIPGIDRMVRISLREIVMDVPAQEVITRDNVSVKVNAVLYFRVDSINRKLQEIIDLQTEPWGVKVRAVEVKQIDLPQEMQRAMAAQAEAEREKRSKVIHAEGEFQAAQRLADASQVLSSQPAALQLRYLQTLSEISTENASTIIFPIPIDILRPFYQVGQPVPAGDAGDEGSEG
jgi:regulator of protease activity HflC (stomatin/prohibitin superfamily)